MKNVTALSFFVLIIIITSCDKKTDNIIQNSEHNICIEIAQDTNWNTENFKFNGEYTIQFPSDYEGTGMIGFEGFIFNKYKSNDGNSTSKISLSYEFCGPLYCDGFGDTLNSSIPSSVMAKDYDGNDVTLDTKKEFCTDGYLLGILYYNTSVSNVTAVYYMRREAEFLNGLSLYFDDTEHQEVENIIKTITKL